MEFNSTYPRILRPKELDALEYVLPADRHGYREYRNHIAGMVVLGEGRRGKGNLVLGFEGDVPDTTSPLAAVVAYGMIETTREGFSITVREYVEKQIDVEIVSGAQQELPDHYEEKRRWTYSDWMPGQLSPATDTPVREIAVDQNTVLAIAGKEKRLWVYNRTSGMVLLIPITNYYNELMLLKNIRDPKVALKSGLLFENLQSYTDADLAAAFHAYNKLRPKVQLLPLVHEQRKRGLKQALLSLFGRKD